MKKQTAAIIMVALLWGCAGTQEANPPAAGEKEVRISCPVSGTGLAASDEAPQVDYRGKTYYFCCSSCRRAFEKDPEKYLGR